MSRKNEANSQATKAHSGKLANLIGLNVRKMRERNDISQEALRLRLETMGITISASSLSKIETRQRRVYDYELYAFSKIFNVEPESLFNERDEQEESVAAENVTDCVE